MNKTQRQVALEALRTTVTAQGNVIRGYTAGELAREYSAVNNLDYVPPYDSMRRAIVQLRNEGYSIQSRPLDGDRTVEYSF
jgi:hypothetical protein